MKEFKLFIFRTHKNWSYAGGSIIIVADKFEDCLSIWNAWIDSKYESEFDRDWYKGARFFETEEQVEDGSDIWVLHRVFTITYNGPEVIMYEFHDG